MHWIMWIFWGSIVTLLVGVNLVNSLTGREKSLNQNSAGNDTLREVGRIDQQTPF